MKGISNPEKKCNLIFVLVLVIVIGKLIFSCDAMANPITISITSTSTNRMSQNNIIGGHYHVP